LQERINVINPFTRTFLVSWISLLDSIPDLELVAYLPSFLGGLFKFLSDPNQDVHTTTQVALDRFLAEIKKIARIKKGIDESRKGHADDGAKRSDSSARSEKSTASVESAVADDKESNLEPELTEDAEEAATTAPSESETANDGVDASGEGAWVPGQDVQVDHPRILDILVTFLSDSSGAHGTIPVP